MQVTAAGIESAALLAQLQAEIFTDPAHGRGWSEAGWASLLASPGAHVLLASNTNEPLELFEPIGFIAFRLVIDEAELLSIGVRAAAQKQGVARALLSAMERQLPAEARIFLEVAEDNQAARAFYSRAGFSPIGRRPGYYTGAQGPVAALLLAKPKG